MGMAMAGRRRPHEETSREAMRRNGVPLAFENGVLDWHGVRKAQPVKDLRNFLRTLVLAVPVIGPFLLFGWALNEHAKSIAAASGAWLVKTNMDLGIVVFVGIGLAVTAWAGAWFEKPEAALSDTARLFGGGNWYPRWYLQPMANAAKDARDADAFLLHVRTQHLRAMGILTGALVALGVAFATAEFENFVVAGPTGLV